ncbi:MAG TPA: ribosome-associated translation inhibitor RaiA [Bacteroidales bacterium]|jgi:putative sigma-54 modulation protein|nr:ribosome-associated translation inhibitor RaiA [Bacteroidales bacterium]HOF45495.1 ribosome-associated translation inhibitor RaiA [Bacteroidales bacterium]HOS57072.1 ribosome-associated translation inhibitor RaiA [Bacteroidales bacterium]HPY80663.1 ribosome-associated translation inhibitor RaiA [Bacteroidales bacterium]HQA86241.1 ribosome-associated translation inhibitor RaiA [Bacteroidales bacterium]
MNIIISALHFKADVKLENFISEKVEKLTKVYDGIMSAEVILKLENTDKPTNKTVEIRLKIRGNDAMSGKTARTFEEATDNAVEALRRQLKKIKDKERGN